MQMKSDNYQKAIYPTDELIRIKQLIDEYFDILSMEEFNLTESMMILNKFSEEIKDIDERQALILMEYHTEKNKDNCTYSRAISNILITRFKNHSLFQKVSYYHYYHGWKSYYNEYNRHAT